MIEPVKKGCGVPRAKGVCDECGKSEVVAADVRAVAGVSHVNEGQVIRKLSAQGWALVKGTLRCPGCEGRRKMATGNEAKNPASADTKLRQPSAKQVREIIGILELVYDDDRKRYKDKESDKTVAEAVGGGCLWGWVAEKREELFGPDTRNQEIEAIRAELNKTAGALGAAVGEVRRVEGLLNDLRARLEKVV